MSNLTLFQIAAEHRELAERLQDMDLPDEIVADTLSAESNLVEKSASVAFVIRNIEAMADACKAEATRMAERAKAIERRAEQVRRYLQEGMEYAGVSKIEHPTFTLSIQKNPPSVEIFSEEQIPALYMKQPDPPAPKPDKKAILVALKSGQDVPGTKIHQGSRLAIK